MLDKVFLWKKKKKFNLLISTDGGDICVCKINHRKDTAKIKAINFSTFKALDEELWYG